MMIGAEQQEKQKKGMESVTTDNFSSFIKKGNVLVYFWANDCVPCGKMSPIMNATSRMKELEGIRFGKFEVHNKLDLISDKFFQDIGVNGTPTILFFKDGKPVGLSLGLNGYESNAAALTRIKETFGKSHLVYGAEGIESGISLCLAVKKEAEATLQKSPRSLLAKTQLEFARKSYSETLGSLGSLEASLKQEKSAFTGNVSAFDSALSLIRRLESNSKEFPGEEDSKTAQELLQLLRSLLQK